MEKGLSIIEEFKKRELLPKGINIKSFREAVGLLKWNVEDVEGVFKEFGFNFSREIPEIDQSVLEKVSENFVRRERIIPYGEDENSVKIFTDNPYNHEGLRFIEWIFSKPVDVLVVPFDKVNEFISSLSKFTVGEQVQDESKDEDILSLVEEAPIVQFVNDLLMTAIRINASDIHFEPFEKYMKVRLRVDGVLHKYTEVPRSKVSSVISRLKVMANLDIAEKRLPQDGRIRIKVGGRDIDIRVSVLPTYFGERVVLRLLSKENVLYSLKELGLLDKDYSLLKRLIESPHGIVLVTGPTGSGKTTTLYASLSSINSEEINIITVEDPVEYQLDGISQVQVKSDIGLTFANALRSILRQDPDVIMIGEIRDLETAEIAIQSALTGHLVFSTLHTNDAPTSITRLIDMGVEPFLVASSIIGVVAQRLVRKICPYCKKSYKPSKEELLGLGIPDYEGEFFKGMGCEKCMYTGYFGRTGIYEILVVSKSVRKSILETKDADYIKEVAVGEGMRTLRADGAEKVKRGITTVSEVLRVTRG